MAARTRAATASRVVNALLVRTVCHSHRPAPATLRLRGVGVVPAATGSVTAGSVASSVDIGRAGSVYPRGLPRNHRSAAAGALGGAAVEVDFSSWYSSSTLTSHTSWVVPEAMFSAVSSAVIIEWSALL